MQEVYAGASQRRQARTAPSDPVCASGSRPEVDEDHETSGRLTTSNITALRRLNLELPSPRFTTDGLMA